MKKKKRILKNKILEFNKYYILKKFDELNYALFRKAKKTKQTSQTRWEPISFYSINKGVEYAIKNATRRFEKDTSTETVEPYSEEQTC